MSEVWLISADMRDGDNTPHRAVSVGEGMERRFVAACDRSRLLSTLTRHFTVSMAKCEACRG